MANWYKGGGGLHHPDEANDNFQKKRIEIWPESPSPCTTWGWHIMGVTCQWGVAHQWGLAYQWGGMSMGGGTFHGGGTSMGDDISLGGGLPLVLTWLVASRGVKWRSCHSWNTVCFFAVRKRHRSKKNDMYLCLYWDIFAENWVNKMS